MISTIILTKNEEKNIIDCVESVDFSDEIIIIDDYSIDRTIDLLENLKNKNIKIFKNKLDGDFSKQRNFALDQAQGDWVLFLDADERIPNELALEIDKIASSSNNKTEGFYIKRKDFIWGKELRHGETGSLKLLRLAKKDSGKWVGKVHEVWDVKGHTSELDNSILHYPHQSISEFLKEINFYTDLRAKELYEKGVKSNFLSIILHTKGKFILNYFIRLGILDGVEGLILALLMSFHSFLVRGKLWLLWSRKKGE